MTRAGAGDGTDASAWRVSPAAYLAGRRAAWTLAPRPSSRYLAMPDGCRLALDLYLPQPRSPQPSDEAADGAASARSFPTVLIFTPYYRRFKRRAGAAGEASPDAGKFRDLLVPHGYAVVIVDVRGTGASFGTRDSFRSPKERADGRAVTDWVVAQPWSDGTVGATGVSYPGAAADFLASTGHPAVRAIAPLFAVWDTYADNYFPGGVPLKELPRVYDTLMVALDHDRRDLLKGFSYYADPDLEGPQPVDEDPDGALLALAIREHGGNFRQTEFMPEFRYREEGLPYDPAFSSASFSPYAVSGAIPRDVAILSVSGWMDGAGYANGAIARYLTLRDNPRHLLLGPWDHGARVDVSPWRRAPEPSFPLLAVVLRLFDHYLQGLATGLDAQAPIQYYALHAEARRAAREWPPVTGATPLHLGSGGRLDADAGAEGSATLQVDFSRGTGEGTRYERIAGINSTSYYADRGGRSARMLRWTTAPLASARELVGHAVATLWLASSEPDAALFVYLSEVEAEGTERYVTEGLLRLLHRREGDAPDTYRVPWPFRTFRREDAAPLVPGRVERIPLLPTAWRSTAGSRVRVSLAGADADHCGQVPHGRPPRLEVAFGGGAPSCIDLPLA